MKTIALAALLSLAATACGTQPQRVSDSSPLTSLQPPEVYLEGKIYSRTVTTTPFGAPHPVEMTYSLAFHPGAIVVDNSSVFFGNPPISAPYAVSGNKLTIQQEYGAEVYSFNADWSTPTNDESGAVYSLQR